MEITSKEKPAWLDASHPNYKRWLRARELSEARGNFVISIIEKFIACKNLSILDLGSGEGGTSLLLSKNNFVISFDISFERLQRQKDKNAKINLIQGNALFTPFKNSSYNLIILQDVIEHVTSPGKLIENIFNMLKPGGIVYLSTPNKLSVFNFIADPHWGVPFVSIMKREHVRKIFLKNFREHEYNRADIAQLLSLNDFVNLLEGKFSFYLQTSHSIRRLFEGDRGIAWSNFHLKLVRVLKILRIDKILLGFSNDKPGILNNFFNPTFYLILKKAES